MNSNDPGYLTKLKWSLPWLARYPLWRAREVVRRITDEQGKQHVIMIVANHFEPSWGRADLSTQRSRLEEWCAKAERIGDAVRDCDGAAFRHTMFYPAEEYHPSLLQRMADLQSDGFGEVEVHLHHGVEKPDTAENLRRTLTEFRDALAEEHKCLSRMNGVGAPRYAFVHGNLALANSAGGRCCGVDAEMQILAETGCYADFTLPSAPDQSQVPRLNAIYSCGHPLDERAPQRSGPSVRVGQSPALPLIFTGPLIFNWRRRLRGLPVPRLDDGCLVAHYPLDLARFNDWRNARIHVEGRPDWVFIKLYCHGFFMQDQPAMIGDDMRRFLDTVLELGEQTGGFKIHFTTAREAFNMVLAATDGLAGDPGQYRDYRLQQIMRVERGGRQERTAEKVEHRQREMPLAQAVD